MGRILLVLVVMIVIIAVIIWASSGLRPGAERKARDAQERRERQEANAAERFPVGSVVRCGACGQDEAEVRERPIVSERRREVRALVACRKCGAVARRRLARLPSWR